MNIRMNKDLMMDLVLMDVKLKCREFIAPKILRGRATGRGIFVDELLVSAQRHLSKEFPSYYINVRPVNTLANGINIRLEEKT